MCDGKPADVSDNDGGISELTKYETDPMTEEDFINYMAVPSLESMALVNVVVQLWKDADVREEIMNHLSELTCSCGSCTRYRPSERLLKISKDISERLSLLPLPNLLKEKARGIVTPIGREMINWLRQLERCRWHCNSKMERIDTVCFTAKGTVDKAKTVELLLGRMELSDVFNMACEYCLDDRIPSLWQQMPKKTRENSFYTCYIFKRYDRHLIAYWTCFMKNELSKLMSMIQPTDLYDCNHSIYRNMFTLSISEGKALAAKYFWGKLTEGERNNNIVKWTCLAMEKCQHVKDFKYKTEYSDVMFFLLSQMNDKEQQRQVLHEYGAVLLRSLYLDWPWKTCLLPTLQSMWIYLKRDVYIDFLSKFLRDVRLFKMDEQLFRVLWCNTPMPFRKHFIQYIGISLNSYFGEYGDVVFRDDKFFAFCALFDIEDKELIKLVLNDADVEERKRISSSAVESHHILYDLIKTENFSFLELLIREYLTSECEIKKFKANKMLEYGHDLCRTWIREDNWQEVEKMLDWGFDSQDQVDALKAKIANRIKADGFLEELSTFKWSSFEGLMNWCFNSEEEMNQFKMDISPYDRMAAFMRHITERNPDIEFPEMFLVWCFSSEKEIVQFKKTLTFSETGLDFILNLTRRFAGAEIDKVITNWFHGFKKEALMEFKRKVEEADIGWPDYHVEHLKCLLAGFICGDTD